MSYAAILRNLKIRVSPEELGAKIGGIRETRAKDLLVELKCNVKDRVGLNSTFHEAIGAPGCVRHLVPTVEVEILDIDPTVEAEDIAKTVWSCLQEEPSSRVEVSLTKRPFRGRRKAFIIMEEARTLKLLKATHINIGWVSTGSAERGRSSDVSAALALATWRPTAGGQFAGGAAENPNRKSLRGRE